MIDTGAVVKSDRIVSWKNLAVGATILSAFYSSIPYAFGAQNTSEAIPGPSDVACILIAMRASDVDDPKKKEALLAGFTYFLGHYRGTHPDEALLGLIQAEIERQELMEPQALNKEQVACGAIVSAAGRVMKTVGSELKKQGR